MTKKLLSTKMPTPFRPARAGDICILLLPDDDEMSRLNEHQRFLTSHFGGQIHQTVHLTVQRFAPPPHSNLQSLTHKKFFLDFL
jgi:hypothetical protein